MPSKTKKQPKSASKTSFSDHSDSPQNSSSLIPVPELETEEDLLRSLEEATKRYPSLIDKSAFIGRITNVKAESKGCRIWLSESSMVASSITPGCTVSVSLAAPVSKYSCSFPLCSLVDGCGKHHGFDRNSKMVTDVGSFFALATVFPSCKVLKKDVQLSSNLSNTLGCPDSGRAIFVCPIQSKSALSANGIRKSYRPSTNCLSLSDCKELFLELVSSQCRLVKNGNLSPGVNFPGERTPNRSENGNISSPATPVHSQSKLNSLVTSQSSSLRSEEPISSFDRSNGTHLDSFSITDLLRDESSKKLLQSCATSWLSSRRLLFGNLVTVPVLSKICIFQVIGAIGESANYVDQHLVDTFNQDSSQASGPMDSVNYAFTVNHETKVNISQPLNSALETPKQGLPRLGHGCADMKDEIVNDTPKLGGLSEEYTALKDIIVSSVRSRVLSRRVKGVLLHGPPGVGKTSLAKKCVLDSGINLVTVNGSEIVSEYLGGSELALQELFRSASKATPVVVFIDELDAIEMSQKMVATLLTIMDTDGTLVVAATSQPDKIEPALRKHGRLEKDIEIGVPSPKQRYDILLVFLSEMKHSLSDIQIQHIASTTHGFVGADLTVLCNEAAMTCFKRNLVWMKSTTPEFDCPQNDTTADSHCSEDSSFCSHETDSPIPSIIKSTLDFRVNGASVHEEPILVVAFDDFEVARGRVRPSSMREVMLEVPKVSWEDVGGQREVKMQLREAVEWPQKYPDAFERIGIRPPTGVLMFGPPGCSKTLLARAVASEAGLNFLAVKGPELFSQWVGESEKAVRSLFAKARENAPSIIFFDEIDSLAVIRGKESDELSVGDRVMSQLLVEMDGFQQRGNVTVIAATNRPDKIDPALLRPGRFDRLLYVGPPSESDRQDIFSIHLRRMSFSSDVCTKELASLTEGYTGADISLICLVAGYAAIEESVQATEVKMEHLKAAIEKVEPSETKSYEELLAKFQRGTQSSVQLDGLADQPLSNLSSRKPFWERRPGLAFKRGWLMKSFTVLAVCSAWLCLRLQPSKALNWFA